jgi:hypothetical protein
MTDEETGFLDLTTQKSDTFRFTMMVEEGGRWKREKEGGGRREKKRESTRC